MQVCVWMCVCMVYEYMYINSVYSIYYITVYVYIYVDMDTFAVNDPGYHRDTYSYTDDVVGFRIFDMVRV